jgi:hypothetical protein
MLILSLYPQDFRVMIGYLNFNLAGQDQVPLRLQTVSMLVLLQYLKTFKAHKLLSWHQRRTDKTYKLSMPLAVAKALHEEMLNAMLTGHQQLLLNKLDQAIVNYTDPFSGFSLLR